MTKDELLVQGHSRLDCLVKSAEAIMVRDLQRDFGVKEVIFLRNKGEADKARKANAVEGRMYTAPPFSEAVIASLFITGLPTIYEELKNDIKNSTWLDATGKRVGSGPPTIQEAYNRALSYNPPKYVGGIAGAYATITKGDPSQLREGGNKGKVKAAMGKTVKGKDPKSGTGGATAKSRYPCAVCHETGHATHTCPFLEEAQKAVAKMNKAETKPFTGATQLDDPAVLAILDTMEQPSVHDADCFPDTESVG
jgi:hypothetical protein